MRAGVSGRRSCSSIALRYLGRAAAERHRPRQSLVGQFAQTRGVGDKDGPAQRQRLKRGDWVGLIVAEQGDDCRAVEQRRHTLPVRRRDQADLDALGQAQALRQAPQIWLVRAGADDPQARVGPLL